MKKKEENKKKTITFETKQLKNTTVNHDDSGAVKFAIALIVIGVFVIGLYFINAKYVTKDKYQEETTTTTTEVSYDDTIILGDNVLIQSDKEYMVLFYDKSADNGSFYKSLVSSYKGDIKLYSVDLSNKMNDKYYSKEKSENVAQTYSSLDGFKAVNPTLVTVKKGKIVSYEAEEKNIYSKLSGTKIN